MKTYIRRDPKAVEPQIRALASHPDPQIAALAWQVLAAVRGPALYLGLYVHSDSIGEPGTRCVGGLKFSR